MFPQNGRMGIIMEIKITLLKSGIFFFLLSFNTVYAEIATIEEAEKFIEQYSEQIDANRNNAKLYMLRGDVYFQTKDFESAVEDYTKAISLDKGLDKAWFGRGMAYGRMGYIKEGIADLTVYIKRNPRDSVAYTKRGVRYLWIGDKDNAEQDLLKAIELNMDNAEAHDDLGVVYAQKDEYKKAIKHFSRTVAIDPSYQKGHHNLAMALYLTENDIGALLSVDRALELKQTRDALLLKSKILEALGRTAEASSLAEEAMFIPEGNWSERAPVR